MHPSENVCADCETHFLTHKHHSLEMLFSFLFETVVRGLFLSQLVRFSICVKKNSGAMLITLPLLRFGCIPRPMKFFFFLVSLPKFQFTVQILHFGVRSDS